MPKFTAMHGVLVTAALALTLPSTAALSQSNSPPPQPSSGTIEADGTVDVPAFQLPPSIYVSEAAKKALPRSPTDPEDGMFRLLASGQVGQYRARMGELMAPRHERLRQTYGVKTELGTIAGIQTVTMTPASGVPKANKGKVLLNLPGGGFVMGAATGTGMVESIPLSGLAKVKIISMTYRQAPEFQFPAATQDIAAVYRELLKTYKPQNIGIFGCSAGGSLTAQAMAWFIREKLPLPGAIGIFCASADSRRSGRGYGGDSRYYARPFQALPPRTEARNYFQPKDETDPIASPILTPDVLRQFPPTLVITATRAAELSAAVNTHRELVKLGVNADLHVWDGLGHAFFYDPALPESREAFDVQTNFFRKHLKLSEK